VVAGAAALALSAIPATAQGAITIGQSPPIVGSAGSCNSGKEFLDVVQLGNLSGNQYRVPAGGGVLTSWRTSQSRISQGEEVRLRAFRQTSPGVVVPVGLSTVVTVKAGQSPLIETAIPVTGGEQLGLSAKGTMNTGCVYIEAGKDDVVGVKSPAGRIGQSESVTTGARFLVNVSATLEPDLDRDGFGDETRDLCPTEAGPCISCRGQAATIVGSDLPEVIVGTAGRDVIAARGGADSVQSKGGNDVVCGGAGNDDLKGQAGGDRLFGEKGEDRLNGGARGDFCNGGRGSDRAPRRCERERSA
jgi:hypothetical protein